MTLLEILKMNDEKLVNLWNEYCEDISAFTDMLYDNDDEAFDTFGFTIAGTTRNASKQLYNWDHKWITSDGYGNPLSAPYAIDLIDPDALAEWSLQD